MQPLRLDCPSCGKRTDLFRANCGNCGTILRDKLPNIDFAKTTIRLIESPTKAIRDILFAEKKNYVVILLLFIAIKNSIIFQILSAILTGNEYFRFGHVQWTIVVMFALVLSGSVAVGLMLKLLKSRVTIRQLGALLVYPQIPLLFSFIALTIPEFIIFGKYLFYRDPNVFFIHPFFAWFFLCIEGLIYLWATGLTFIAFLHISTNKLAAILFSLMALCLMYVTPYFILLILHM